MAKKELAVGEQKGGVWRRSADTYYVRMVVDGKRQYINAGNDYQAALLLAQDAKSRRQQEKLTGRNTVLGQLFKQKSQLTLGEIIDRYIKVKRPILKPATVTFYSNLLPYVESLKEEEVDELTTTDVSAFISGLIFPLLCGQ
jgi:hypothetical protein